MNRILKFAVLTGLVLVMSTNSEASSFLVTLDTSPLSGTQTLAFGLTNNDGGVNTVTLTAFEFGGGSAIAGTEDCTLGGALSGLGCSGDLVTGVTLTDSDFQAFFTQQFDAGSSLSFILSTTNSFVGATPDQLRMYVCDGTFTECYSDDPASSAMLVLDLTGGSLSPGSFSTYGAGLQELDAPVVTEVADPAAVPEPATLFLLGSGLVAMARKGRRRIA
jgi:hypothetical protein